MALPQPFRQPIIHIFRAVTQAKIHAVLIGGLAIAINQAQAGASVRITSDVDLDVSDVTRLRPFLEGNQWYTRPGSMPTRLKATHLAQKNRHIACDIASDRGSVFIDDILPHTRVVEVDGVEIRYADPMLLLVQKIITYAERGAGMEAKLAVDLADINFCIEQLLPDQHPVSATLQATYLKEETRHAFLERLPPQNKHHYIELLRFVGIEIEV